MDDGSCSGKCEIKFDFSYVSCIPKPGQLAPEMRLSLARILSVKIVVIGLGKRYRRQYGHVSQPTHLRIISGRSSMA
jgi:hypothetical protein